MKVDYRIMYVYCSDANPECCGHYDRSELRVMPDGRWLCEECLEEERVTDDEGELIDYDTFQMPPSTDPCHEKRQGDQVDQSVPATDLHPRDGVVKRPCRHDVLSVR